MILHTIYEVKKLKFFIKLTWGNGGLSNVRTFWDRFGRHPGMVKANPKRDLEAMPEVVKNVVDHAIDLAQASGKHHYAKVMSFGCEASCLS